ncbi:MAG: OmpH family outer membrane protein [Phycisphaeraceae bacterium]
MTRPRTIVICLLAAFVLGFGFAGLGVQRLQAQNESKAARTAVAVVNVAELIAKSQKNKDFQAEVQKKQVSLRQEQKDRETKINQMRTDLDLIDNAQKRSDKEREITKALYEFQAWQNIEQQNLLREQRMFLIELYGEIDNAVAMIANREGVDLVMLDTPTPRFDDLNAEQLVQAIGNRRVIYRGEKVNLTPIVLEKLNLDHLNRGGN